MLTPCTSARSQARWITGPSAIGSENGTPSSSTSAPPSTSACSSGTVRSGCGSPAVMKVTRPVLPCCFRASKVGAILDMPFSRSAEVEAGALRDRVHVLVAAARQVDQDDLVFRQRRRQLDGVGDRVRGLERRDDALDAAAVVESGQRFLIGDRDVLRAFDVLQPGVLGTDARVVQAGRDRVGLDDLAVLVLQQVGAVAVQDAREAGAQRRRMLAAVNALARRLDAD